MAIGSDRAALNLAKRVQAALVVISAVFLVIVLRLWYLQIVQGDYFRYKSENNRIRQVFVSPPRGLIFDRHGEVLVKNRPSFSVELVAEDSPDPEFSIEKVAEILGRDAEAIKTTAKQQRKRRPFEPRLLVRDITRDELARVMAARWQLPGVVVNVSPARDYLYGDLAAHVLGYIREITKAQLDSPAYSGYRMGELVGQYGLEARFERYLQGQRGVKAVVVNANGTKIDEASFEPEYAGHNLTLTLDLDVQKAADLALKDKSGAIVAIDPGSGEILAMSSAPRFDPNMFVSDIPQEVWQDLVAGPGKKLNNRAVQGAYPPGSVFKIFVEAAAFSEKIVSKGEHISCPGYMQFGNTRFRCHKSSGHGPVSHFEGLVQSCDVYFYNLGNRLGVDRIHEYALRFGLGRPTGLELVDENPGLIPSTEWKKKYFKKPEDQKWYPGETPSVAIGQGAVTTTPLQIARALSALLNGGLVLKPYLVRKVESHDGLFIDDTYSSTIVDKVDLEERIRQMLIADLIGVVNNERGTGKRAKLPQEFDVTVGGKTGTAQVVGLRHGSRLEQHEDHAWFAGFGMTEQPDIVAVALVENGGHGGVAAAPLVKEVLQAFYAKKLGIAVKSDGNTAPKKEPAAEDGADAD
ncbi:MAG: penicillin-binding protein 2 [Proteobacteria bacterium]|nr:MAG: penicillin-binding protein 2 [Pseudomonadota bacterium]